MSAPSNMDPQTDGPASPTPENGERFRRLVESAPNIVMILDEDFTIMYVNQSIERLLGYRKEKVLETDIWGYLHEEDADSVRENLSAKHDVSSSSTPTVEIRLKHAGGSWRYFEAFFEGLSGDPVVGGTAVYLHDITESRILRSALAHRSFHDPLTGLPNRNLFMDRLEHALARAVRQRKSVTVFFIDLDNFKVVNDSLGHEAGDDLLVAMGRRLKACIRPEDTIARFGGDEFAVLLEFSSDLIDAIRVVERIMEASTMPIVFRDHQRFITTSVGVAHTESGTVRVEDLLWQADLAMYRAKEKGKARFELFEREMSELAYKRVKLERGLRSALSKDQLKIYYQPEVSLEDSSIVGMEALLRWEYPGHGRVPPMEFVPLAETNGMIVPIGRWILEKVCQQAMTWQDTHPNDAPLVSVNLSAKQFRQPTLAEEVDAALQKTGLDPTGLMLEVTEGFSINDVPHVAATAQKLRDLGVKIALDDFGTERSSFSYLERLPVDMLKIDRSLIDRLGQNGDSSRKLVSAMLKFARMMGVRAVAEGVETVGQLDELSDMGCELAQGFYFWKPLTDAEATELLKSKLQ